MNIEDEVLKRIDEINQLIKGTSLNPFDNYNYRVWGMKRLLEENDIFSNISISSRRTGKDAFADDFENIEFKSCSFNTVKLTGSSAGKMVFDKQNDPLRREETLKYNAFVHGSFKGTGAMPKALFVFKSKNSIEIINEIIKTLQKEFVEKWNRDHENSRRGRDDIAISIKEIINTIDDENDVVIFIEGKKVSLKSYKDNTEGRKGITISD